MSLVVAAASTSSSVTTNDITYSTDFSSTIVQAVHLLAAPNLRLQTTPVKTASTIQHLHLRNRRPTVIVNGNTGSAFSFISPPVKRSRSPLCIDLTTSAEPAKSVAKRLAADLDPTVVFEVDGGGNSRDSGFDSETSRLSYGRSSTNSAGGSNGNLSTTSNPGTPSSSTSGVSSSSGLCASDQLIGDDTQQKNESLRLCQWENCADPNLRLADDQDLLSHVLREHVQPLEQQQKLHQQPSFKCLWTGCKVYGKGSKLFSWLEGHVIERHGGRRPFACPLPGCRLRFSSKAAAERHVNSHFANDDQAEAADSHCSSMTPNSKKIDQGEGDDRTEKLTSPKPRRHLKRRPDGKFAPRSPSRDEDGATKFKSSSEKKCRRKISTDKRKEKCRKNGLSKKKFFENATLRCSPRRSRSTLRRMCSNDAKNSIAGTGGEKEFAASISKKNQGGKEKDKRKTAEDSNKIIFAQTATTGLEVIVQQQPANYSTAINGGGKRKTLRFKSLPEDAFDATHFRALHVLTAKSILINTKNACSSSKSSGICRHRRATTGNTNGHKCDCNVDDMVTFHTKVLAKRTLNGKDDTSTTSKSRCQLFCSWTPAGYLPPKWLDDTDFRSTIFLSRRLFPTLLHQRTSIDC